MSINITGTLVWYYFICARQVWLMAHQICPLQEDPFLEMGRVIHEKTYPKDRKGFETIGMKIDLIKREGSNLLVAEIKKSSRFLKAASMQLIYYLWRLKELGIIANGVVLIPKEKKHFNVSLDNDLEKELKDAIFQIERIVELEIPPKPQKTKYCYKCAYFEFCWA